MILEFDNAMDEKWNALEEDYRIIMAKALEEVGASDNVEVDVSIVDEPTIQQINRDYRNIDRVTDVISFAFDDDQSDLGRINDSEHPKMLGEIFICLPRALQQAEEIGNTPQRELRFLFAHGMLHLLGYDHQSKEEEDIMFPLQEKILERAFAKE